MISSQSSWTALKGVVLASVALLGLANLGCGQDDRGQDIGQAKRSADHYGGMYVTVSGEVEEKQGPHLYKIENDELFGEELWIVDPRGHGAELDADAEILVTGKMKEISILDLERDYDLQLPGRYAAEIQDEVLMIADEVSVLEQAAGVDDRMFEDEHQRERQPFNDEVVGG